MNLFGLISLDLLGLLLEALVGELQRSGFGEIHFAVELFLKLGRLEVPLAVNRPYLLHLRGLQNPLVDV